MTLLQSQEIIQRKAAIVMKLQKELKIFKESIYGLAKYNCEVGQPSQTALLKEQADAGPDFCVKWGSESRFKRLVLENNNGPGRSCSRDIEVVRCYEGLRLRVTK